MTHFLSASYSTDERRDEQPAVLQQGERRVTDHVLDVVIETVGACRVSRNGTLFCNLNASLSQCLDALQGSGDEDKGEEGASVDVWGNQTKMNGHSKEEEEWMMKTMHRSFPLCQK